MEARAGVELRHLDHVPAEQYTRLGLFTVSPRSGERLARQPLDVTLRFAAPMPHQPLAMPAGAYVWRINALRGGRLTGAERKIVRSRSSSASRASGRSKIDQAEAYAQRADPTLPRRTPGTTGDATGGFKLSPASKTSEYDGVLYAFSTKTEADDAIAMMRRSKWTRPLLGKHPGGINVIFLDSDGALKVLKLDPVLPQGKLR